MVRIITDSTADISAENAEKLGITVLPLTINFGEETYRDGVDITNKEFYDKLATVNELPKTAQIPPAIFADTFKKYLDEGDEIVCLLIASKLSGTRQSAIIAADMLETDKVYVPDTQTVTIGLGLMVTVACDMRDKGASAKEIADKITELSDRICIIAAVATLKYLHMGGRLSGAAAVIGGMLGICPLISVEHGEIKSIGKARGMNSAVKSLDEKLKHEGYTVDSSMPIAFGDTQAPDLRKILLEQLSYVGDCVLVSEIGSVVGTHVGQGGGGIAYFKK